MLLIKQLHLNIVVQILKSKMILVQAWVSKLAVHISFLERLMILRPATWTAQWMRHKHNPT
jgi:hypothetical protein